MSQKQERLIEFDVLRVVALLLILYTHSNSYIIAIPMLEEFRLGGMYTGLGLFVFLSGYSLQYSVSFRRKESQFNTLEFLKRRLIRIYPLYILATFAYIAAFHYGRIYHDWVYKPLLETITLHLLSLQAIFYPAYPEIRTLWFIGMIIPFYLFFAISVQHKTRNFIAINSLIFISLVLLKLIFGIVDLRFFIYYPVFIAGCLYERTNLINRWFSKRWTIAWIFSLLTLGLYFSFNHLDISKLPIKQITDSQQYLNFAVVFLYMLASITALLAIAFSISKVFDRFKQPITYIANLSYPAYLFHRIVYAFAYSLLYEHLGLSMNVGTVLFPIITVALFLTAALIARGESAFYKLTLRQA